MNRHTENIFEEMVKRQIDEDVRMRSSDERDRLHRSKLAKLAQDNFDVTLRSDSRGGLKFGDFITIYPNGRIIALTNIDLTQLAGTLAATIEVTTKEQYKIIRRYGGM